MERSEIQEAYRWDLEEIFPDDSAWEEAFARVKEEVPKAAAFSGRLSEGPDVLRAALDQCANTERAMDMLIKSLKQTDDNKEFLARPAKKGQGTNTSRDTTLM